MIRDIPKFVKTSLLLFLLALIGIYVFLNTRVFIQGPKIIIETPEDGFSSQNKLVEIGGQSLNSTFISVNGRPIMVDKDGNFEEWVLLNYGYNVLVFEARDRFERHISQKLHLVYNEQRPDLHQIVPSDNSDEVDIDDDSGNHLETDSNDIYENL